MFASQLCRQSCSGGHCMDTSGTKCEEWLFIQGRGQEGGLGGTDHLYKSAAPQVPTLPSFRQPN